LSQEVTPLGLEPRTY